MDSGQFDAVTLQTHAQQRRLHNNGYRSQVVGGRGNLQQSRQLQMMKHRLKGRRKNTRCSPSIMAVTDMFVPVTILRKFSLRYLSLIVWARDPRESKLMML